jgi:hypothetical protein
MVPKFANPHLLSQDVEITTRSEIAERAGLPSIVHDEDSHSLKRDLDSLLRDTWADVLAKSLSRAKKHRRAVESHKTEDGQLGKNRLHRSTFVLKHPVAFRLVSRTYPQYISLDPKPSAPPVYVSAVPGCTHVSHHLTSSKEPGCEDDEVQAETRKARALSVAVDLDSLVEAAVSTRQVDPKVVPLT